MKHIFRIVILSAVFAVSTCNKYDAPWTPEEGPQYLTEVVFSNTFTVEEGVNKLLEKYPVIDPNAEVLQTIKGVLKSSFDRVLRIVTIKYNTIDPFGKPIVANGSFIYPVDLKPKGVIEVPPIAYLNYYSNSINARNGEYFEEMTPSFLGFITIVPDLIGGALSKDSEMAKYMKPMLIGENNGRVSYDMRKAVAEYFYIHENGYQLSKETQLMGYSLGGHTALQVAKYYQENTDIKVSEVYVGGGVYDANLAFKYYMTWTRMPYLGIPYIMKSLDTYYNIGLDYSKIFTGTMANSVPVASAAEGGDGYAYWFDNLHGSGELDDRWGTDLHSYMHPDFFNPEPTGEFKKLTRYLSMNSLVENYWPNKETHVHIIHAVDDDYVPYELATALYDALKERGCKVYKHFSKGGHRNSAASFMVKIFTLLFMDHDSHDSQEIQNIIDGINL